MQKVSFLIIIIALLSLSISVGAQSLDPFYNTSSETFKQATDSNGCEVKMSGIFSNQNFEKMLAFNKKLPNKCIYNISELKNPYSSEYCNKVSFCKNEKLRNNPISNKKYLEIAAKYAVQERLSKSIVKMERLEKVKRFTQLQKYSDMGNKCSNRFKTSSANSLKCDERMDKIFFEMPKINNLDYKDYGEKTAKMSSYKFSGYFEGRADYALKNVMENEGKNIDELVGILTNDKKSSVEKKVLFLGTIAELDNKTLLDPVLSFRNTESFESIFKSFLNNVLSMDKLTKENIKKELLSFREDRARKILNDKCLPEESVANFCDKAERVENGEKLVRNISDARKDHGKKITERDKVFLEKMHKEFFPNSNAVEDNYESSKVFVEDMRCSIYSLNAITKLESNDNDYFIKTPLRALPAFGDYAPRARVVEVDSYGNPRVNSSESAPAPVVDSGVREVIAATTDAQVSSFPTNSITSPANIGFGDNLENVEKSDTESKIKAVNPVNENDSHNAKVEKSKDQKDLESRISELNKRLTEADENINKLKAEKETTEGNAKAVKIEESKNLIKELKNEIADLRNQQNERFQRNNDYSNNSQIKNGIMNLPVNNNSNNNQAEQHNYDAKNLPHENNPSSSNMSSSNSSAPVFTKQGGVDSSIKKDIEIVLLDNKYGEPLTDSISRKIIELGEKSFFIEEGGVVKEIIPIYKNGKLVLDENGKPMFEKIIKGKVGSKAGLKKDAIVIAPINSNAELIKNQEKLTKEQLERAQYLKLKSLSEDAIGKSHK